MVWIDSVFSLAYQAAKVAASATAKTIVVITRRDAEVVGEVVGDQRADDADQHDREPVDPRHVAAEPELEEQRDDQEGGHDQRRVGQAEPEVRVEEVRRGLARRWCARILMIQK